MTCRVIVDTPGATIISCDRNARCKACGGRAATKCGFPLRGRLAGKVCGADLCGPHATGPNRDRCEPHARLEEKEAARG